MPLSQIQMQAVEHRRALFPWAIGAAILLLAAAGLTHAYWATPKGHAGLHSAWVDVIFLALALPMTCYRAWKEPAERRGWVLLAISLFLSLFSACLGLVVDIRILNAESIGRPEIIIRLGAGVFTALGMLSWPLAPTTARERWRKAMDGLVFALGLFFILWALAWGDIFAASTQNLDHKVITLAFPLMYIMLVGIAIYLGARTPSLFRGPLGWISLGLLISFVGNLLWGVLSLRGSYHVGHSLDVTSFSIPLIRAVAPFSPTPVGGPPTTDESHDTTFLGWILPYLPLGPAVAVAVYRLQQGVTVWDPILLWTAMGMGLVLLARQFLAMRDLKDLSRNLEQKVEARTASLEQSQTMVLSTVRMNAMASLGAGLAHDLNNLLGAARNYNELAREELEAGNLPEAHHLDRVEQALARAGELTSRLMAFGRAEDDTPVAFELGRHVREAVAILRVLLPRSIRLEVNTAPEPIMVLGHPAQLDQILVNLVSNARDAMPQGGRITLRARRTEEGMAQLEVEDTGHGMSDEVQARVFEAFFTTKPKGKGTGLGLASVRTLVTQAGGEIMLWSAEGQGTRFTLMWPLG